VPPVLLPVITDGMGMNCVIADHDITSVGSSGSTPDPEWLSTRLSRISGFSYEYTVAVATSNRGARTLSQFWGVLSADTT